MNLKLSLLFLVALTSASFAGTPAAAVVETQPPVEHIYRSNAFDIETGGLWEIGSNTPIAYQLWETQLSWRTKRMFGWEFANGSTLSVRTSPRRFSRSASAPSRAANASSRAASSASNSSLVSVTVFITGLD